MLARSRRLRRPGDITRVYRRGRPGGVPGLSLRCLITGATYTRIAVVVPKKVSTKAVVRNRLRRQVTEQLAQQWSKFKPGADIVITLQTELMTVTTASELQRRLHTALERAGALKLE